MPNQNRSHLIYFFHYSTEIDLSLAIEVFKSWCHKFVNDNQKQYGFVRLSDDTGKLFLNTTEPMIDLVLSGYVKILTDDLTQRCNVRITKTVSE